MSLSLSQHGEPSNSAYSSDPVPLAQAKALAEIELLKVQATEVLKRAKQCSHCGRCWPFASFSNQSFDGQCLRCSDPSREVSRWSGLHADMIHAAEAARIRRHSKNLTTPFPTVVSRKPSPLPTQPLSSIPAASTGSLDKFRFTLLNDHQLEGVGKNLKGLKKLAEPARAVLWIQLNFRPGPPSSRVPQTTIFESYNLFLSTKSKKDPESVAGAELVRLPEKIWPGEVTLIGPPHYHLQGLEIRNLNPVSAAEDVGDGIDAWTNGPGSVFGGTGSSGIAITPLPQIHSSFPTDDSDTDLARKPYLDSNDISQEGEIAESKQHVKVPSYLFGKNRRGAPVTKVVSDAPAHMDTAPSETSYTLDSIRPIASATIMSRRASNNAPPLIEAALGKRPRSADGRSSVAMEATSSNESAKEDNDWAALRFKKPRNSQGPLQVLDNSNMTRKGFEVLPKHDNKAPENGVAVNREADDQTSIAFGNTDSFAYQDSVVPYKGKGHQVVTAGADDAHLEIEENEVGDLL